MSFSFSVKLKNNVEKIQTAAQVSFHSVMILQLKYDVQDFFWYLIHVYGKCYKTSSTSFYAKKA